MALKIIYGCSGSGKTDMCFDIIKSKLDKGEKLIYMVPEQFSLESERKIVSQFSISASSLVEVLSFERLSHQVFSRFGPLYKEYINEAGRQMLVQKSLLSIENRLTVLSDAAKQPDFANEVSGMISEFKRHNVKNEKLDELIAKTSDFEQNPILKYKLQDLALIYKAYCNNISKNIGDDEESLNILKEKIMQNNLFSDTCFIIDQFASFTEQEYEVIKAIIMKSNNVFITLTTDSLERNNNGIDVFAEIKETADRLIHLALDNGVEILPNTYLGECKKYDKNPELKHLESNYFKYPCKLYDKPTKNIIVFSANNYIGEVDSAAKRVLNICREQGIRYSDVVLITRNEEIYYPLVRHVFAEYGINVFINDKKSASSHPISQVIISLLNILIHNWNSKNVLQYLKLGFSDIQENDIYLLENYVLASGLNHGQWIQEKHLSFLPQGFTEEELEKINQIRRIAVEPVLEFKNKFSGRKKSRDIAEALYSFFINNNVAEKAKQIISDFENKDLKEQSKEWKLAWDMIINTLDQIVEILSDEYITFERFLSVFSSGLSCFNLAQAPPMVDQVQLCSFDGFKSKGAKILMVLGTTEGVLPKGYMQEGILTDADRKVLKDKGLVLAKDIISRQKAEQFLIYNSITAPLEKLYFFYPLADNEGKSCSPSPIISRLKKLFPALTIENNIYSSNDIDLEGSKQLFWQAIEKIAKKEPLDEKWQTLILWYQHNWQAQFNYALSALSYTNLPKKLSKTSLDIIYGESPFTSISKIEGYSRCQFAHFLQYGLAVKPRKEYELQAVDIGSLMHNIIEKFSLHMLEIEGGWKQLNKNYAEAKIAVISDDVLKEYLGDIELGSSRFNQLSLKLKRIMSVTLWSVAEFYKKSSYEPLGYELAFGTESDLPPLEIKLENGQIVRLVGKIDRVDLARTEKGNFISVVDYKSSSKDMDYSYIMAGIQVQLPVYIDALCKAFSKKDKTNYIKAAMLYYKIDAPVINAERCADDEAIWKATVKELKMRGIINENSNDDLTVVVAPNSTIPSEKIDILCDFTLNKLKKVMHEMLSGQINISPFRSGSQTACEYCPYLSVCQFDTDFEGNKYRSLRKIKKEEFFDYAGKMD